MLKNIKRQCPTTFPLQNIRSKPAWRIAFISGKLGWHLHYRLMLGDNRDNLPSPVTYFVFCSRFEENSGFLPHHLVRGGWFIPRRNDFKIHIQGRSYIGEEQKHNIVNILKIYHLKTKCLVSIHYAYNMLVINWETTDMLTCWGNIWDSSWPFCGEHVVFETWIIQFQYLPDIYFSKKGNLQLV